MFLSVDLLFNSLPLWHFWYFGPHMGGIGPFLLFFGALLLFSFLRRAGGYNRHRGGYYGPRPPYYRPRPPYQAQDKANSDLPRPEQNTGRPTGGPGQYDPYAGQYDATYGTPYGSYAAPIPPVTPGQDTIRVDSLGQPTVRVGLPATTIRMDSADAGDHSTTPLGNIPQLYAEKGRIEPGEIDRAEDNQD